MIMVPAVLLLSSSVASHSSTPGNPAQQYKVIRISGENCRNINQIKL